MEVVKLVTKESSKGGGNSREEVGAHGWGSDSARATSGLPLEPSTKLVLRMQKRAEGWSQLPKIG